MASSPWCIVHADVSRRLPVPVIARIEGWTLGARLEVAAACDMRVAAIGAQFGMPEVRLDCRPWWSAALLPGLIGWGRTRRLLLTGETIDAATARSWGLVEEVVAVEQLDAAVERLVEAILASGPHAVRLQKALIEDWQAMAVDAAIQHGIDGSVDAWASDEPRRMLAHSCTGDAEARRISRSDWRLACRVGKPSTAAESSPRSG